MSLPPAPDPTRTTKRFILAAFSFVALMASGVGVVACSIGLADTGHPAMIVGLAGSALGIAAAFVVMWTALRAER